MTIIDTSIDEIQKKIILFQESALLKAKEIDIEGSKWFEYDKIKESLLSKHNDLYLKINIGGKVFKVLLNTILNNPDTLFYNLIVSKDWDVTEELFFDRDSTYFSYILSYLRYKSINIRQLTEDELKELYKESTYFSIKDLSDLLLLSISKIYIVSMEFSGPYISGNITVGTNNFEDLNNFEDRSCTLGICTQYDGWIIFEMNREFTTGSIEIGGYRGNTGLYSNSNGCGAAIQVSIDKINWKEVGKISSSYGNEICLHTFEETTGKYIRLKHNSYLGVGYFRIL